MARKRSTADKVVSEAREQYLVDRRGQKASVLIPIKDYDRLLEDLHDLAVVAERRDEPTISLEEIKRRLQADGLLPR